MKKVDMLVRAPHFYTMQGAGVGYINDMVMLVDGGKITDFVPKSQAGDYKAEEEIELPHHAVFPGFIDGHIHIESTMMTPAELSKVVSVHGTTSIVADPHEIANVCGTAGIKYILG